MMEASLAAGTGTGFDLAGVRARAAARLSQIGLPHGRLEAWRFANPAAITGRTWRVATDERPDVAGTNGSVAQPLGDWPRHEATLAAGRLVGGGKLTAADGLRVESLAAAAVRTPSDVAPHLARIALADEPSHAFVTQNTALFVDGVFVSVPAGVAVPHPVVVRHMRGAKDGGGALVPDRVLVTVGTGASLVLVEDLRSAADGGNGDFLNAVTEIALGEGARLTVIRLVDRPESAHEALVASTWVRAARGASFDSRTFALGGRFVRDDLHVVFEGEGAEASLDGLFVVAGRDVVDHHTTLDHAVPACMSRELYKGVLAESGRGVFNGAVIIRPDAQKSDSAQKNPNLLLSNDATIHTKPELQIWADDVKCAHGATVGRLDTDQLFYLRARGIDEAAARALLVHAFAREIVDRVDHDGLRNDVDAWVEARMERLAQEVA